MSDRHVSIRMYNVGFGDCFLVTIPTSAGDRRILFDCGSMAKGNKDMDEMVDQLLDDLREFSDPPRIDVIVCSHRHRDHVSGFAKPAWNEVDVGEVWMPWTEDPDDSEATRIRQAQVSLAAALTRDVNVRLSAAGLGDDDRAELEAFRDLAMNAGLNESAMDMLHQGFLKRQAIPRRFLPEPDSDNENELVTRFTTPLLPGVVIHVLGPSRDEEVIRDIDPPAGKSYMHLAAFDTDNPDVIADAPDAFSSDWWTDGDPFLVGPKDRERIQQFSLGFSSPVAAALDAAVNGTSLMLLLQIDDLYLLFPGDAQWGTWNAVLRSPRWSKLLKRVRFYKIGHHGSHNATPKEFVEKTIDKNLGVIAMASTRKFGKWPVPLPELLDELTLRDVKIARSDLPPDNDNGTFLVHPDVVETRIPM